MADLNNIHFKMPVGNDFQLRIKLKFLDGTSIPAVGLYDTKIVIGIGGRNMKEYAFHTDGDKFIVPIPSGMVLGQYDVHIYSHIDGRKIAAHYKNLIEIVQWGEAAPVDVCDADLDVIGYSNAQITALEERLEAAIADAEAKEAEYNRLIELVDVAKEITQEAIYDKVMEGISVDLSPVTNMLKDSEGNNMITKIWNSVSGIFNKADDILRNMAKGSMISSLKDWIRRMIAGDSLVPTYIENDFHRAVYSQTKYRGYDTFHFYSSDDAEYPVYVVKGIPAVGEEIYLCATDEGFPAEDSDLSTISKIYNASMADLATEANATANKNAIINAIDELPIPSVTQFQDGLSKAGEYNEKLGDIEDKVDNIQTDVSTINSDTQLTNEYLENDVYGLEAIKGELTNEEHGLSMIYGAAESAQSAAVSAESGITSVSAALGEDSDPAEPKSLHEKVDSISQELGNLSAIFSGITAQDITDEYNAE